MRGENFVGVPVQQNTISFHIHFREIVLEYVLEIHMDKQNNLYFIYSIFFVWNFG